MRPEDRALVARESALSGMSLLLDDDAVAAELRERLPEAGVRGVRSSYVRYKPGTNCLVAFEIATAAGSRLAYGRCEHEDDGAKLRKAHRKARSGALLVEDPPVALLLFPSDRRLRFLPKVITSMHSVLAYKPERRIVARRGSEVVKAYDSAGFAPARAAAAAMPPGLPLQRCVGASARRPVLEFSWIDGAPLDRALEASLDPAGPADATAAVRAAREALRALHAASPAAPLPRRTRAVEAAALATAADATAVAGPGVGRAARRLAERLAAALPSDPAADSLLHGDFSADQVVLGDAGAVLLDMDAACVGDPRWDVGAALGDLELRVLEGRLAPATAAAAAAVFAGEDADTVRRFTAAGLLRRAAEPFRRRRPGWDELVERAVERAAELAALPTARPIGPARASTGAPELASPRARTGAAGVASPPTLECGLESLRRISPPPGAPLAGTLMLRRAWPRPDGRMLLEYRDERGAIVAGQAGLGRDDIAGECRRAERAGAPAPIVADARVLLHARGADGRLPALHRLLQQPGARLVAHRATKRAVVAFDGAAYVKVVRPSRTRAVADAARAAARIVAGAFAVPAVLAVDASAGTVAYAPMLGRRLTDLLPTRAGTAAIEALGTALRALHDAEPPPRVGLHDSAREASLVTHAAAALEPYAPALAERASAAAQAAARRLASLPPVAPSPVHRDLHDKQVLVADSDIGLLDFDTLALGDPALDLGNMLAHLELRALQDRCEPDDPERLAAALLEGYRAETRMRERIAAYAEATRVRLACVYAFRPSWREVPVALLAARDPALSHY